MTVLLCGVSALILRALLLPILPVPIPFIQDEFSYLLAGDTFAHGRLTNPTPPMWSHFETFHVIFEPTYASKYPPMQGLILGAGKVLLGHPFAAVVLSVAIMCSLICWMLQAWIPPTWALLGGLLAIIRFGVFSYWDNSYWGGAAGAIGGALVLGALPRITRRLKVRDAGILAFGIGVLANSRPYEGLVMILPVAFLLLLWVAGKKTPDLRMSAVRIVVSVLFCLMPISAATGYYFWRVTGSPFRMPYQVNQDRYAPARYFIWQAPRPAPLYRHRVMYDYYMKAELPQQLKMRTLSGFFQETLVKTLRTWLFFIGPALTVPLLMMYRVTRDRRVRWLIIIGATSLAGSAATTIFFPHYVSPIVALILVLVLQGMRHLKTWRLDGEPTGLFLVRATVTICLISVILQTGDLMRRYRLGSRQPGSARSDVMARLSSLPGRQLALVRYRPDHAVLAPDWVDNDADVVNSKVLWARDMGTRDNQELLDYFKDRQSWLVEPDETPPKLTPYAPTLQSQQNRLSGKISNCQVQADKSCSE